MPDDDVLVLPPVPADPVFVTAVDDALAGAGEHPEAQPARPLGVDPHDFASLYIRHRSSFALHARRFLHDPRDVDEVLQEAFLRLFLALPELDTELQALSYCRRTVTNLCIDRYRTDQRRPRLVDLDEMTIDPRDAASYDDPVLRAEDAAIVRQALSLLSPMHRAALVKREIEEKPLPQIAAELEIPEESVKHLLYRARRALRRLLVGTSVEPGVDLGNTELLRLANRRLARATLRATNVLIVLFVTAVTVVGGFRIGSQDRIEGSGDLPSAVTPEVVGAAANPAHPMAPVHQDSGAKSSAAAHPAVPRHDEPVPGHADAAPAPGSVPAHHRADAHPSSGWEPAPVPTQSRHDSSDGAAGGEGAPGGSPPPPPPVVDGTPYMVEGAYAADGAATVTHLQVDPTASIATSRFVAPTTAGVLQIDQTVGTAGNPAIAVDPTLTVDGQQQQIELGQIVIDSHRQSDGSVAMTLFATVDGVAPAIPTAATTSAAGISARAALAPVGSGSPTTAASAAATAATPPTAAPAAQPSAAPAPTALTIALVLSPDRTRVLYEHVAVAA